jgi:hypothetical protein
MAFCYKTSYLVCVVRLSRINQVEVILYAYDILLVLFNLV